MARAGEMIRTTAGALLIPEVTVGLFYKELRRYGFMSTTGRGRSASHVQPLDVARLLIAILSSDVVREAPSKVRLFGRLRESPNETIGAQDRAPDRISIKGEHLESKLANMLLALAEISAGEEELQVLRHALHVNVSYLLASLVTPHESFLFGPASNPLAEAHERGLGMEVTRGVGGYALKAIADLVGFSRRE